MASAKMDVPVPRPKIMWVTPKVFFMVSTDPHLLSCQVSVDSWTITFLTVRGDCYWSRLQSAELASQLVACRGQYNYTDCPTRQYIACSSDCLTYNLQHDRLFLFISSHSSVPKIGITRSTEFWKVYSSPTKVASHCIPRTPPAWPDSVEARFTQLTLGNAVLFFLGLKTCTISCNLST